MSRGLPRTVRDNIKKCHLAAIAAVEVYNRPGKQFRTAQYVIMITIAWTALFHALFYYKKIKPWYKENGRFVKLDGEPKHWDLSECLKKHYDSDDSPARKNLKFLIGLRNKIEHRNLPELDPSLYGECQAALINLEELLVEIFGEKYALTDQLAVSLQFSRMMPTEKKRAAKILASKEVKTVTNYIETFRGRLPSSVLKSIKYSFNVFLVPQVTNRISAADAAVTFIKVDEADDMEIKRLEKLNVLIKEKKIPIANLDLLKPSQVIEKVNSACKNIVSMNVHTECWRHFSVRPPTGCKKPDVCKSDYCVYDEAHKDYLYTNAWVKKITAALNNDETFKEITGRDPVRRQV